MSMNRNRTATAFGDSPTVPEPLAGASAPSSADGIGEVNDNIHTPTSPEVTHPDVGQGT
jgi:hypothetical protein